MRGFDERELRELAADLACALLAFSEDLEMAQDTDIPVPDGLQKKLDERIALAATMKRACEELGVDREKMKAIYREEIAGADDDDFEMPGWPILPEVKQQAQEALEGFRRAILHDGELYVASLGVMPIWW